MIHIGAYGQTVFGLLLSDHIDGSKLQLRTREGYISIGRRELEIIEGLTEVFGIECDANTVSVLTDRIYGKQMKELG